MSKVKIKGNASGTGVLTIEAPNTNTDRTITLPDGTGELIQADASGNVGIGVTPESWNTAYNGVLEIGDGHILSHNDVGDGIELGANFYHDGTGHKRKSANEATRFYMSDGTYGFQVTGNGTADSAISWTTAMQINNDGQMDLAARNVTGANCAVIRTAGDGDHAGGVGSSGNGIAVATLGNGTNADDWAYVADVGYGQVLSSRFRGTHIGGISNWSTTTSFNTSSDYRLKENEVPMSGAITRLKELKPYRFNWKIEPDEEVDGFFAHEVTPVVPVAVTGEKDAVHPAILWNENDVMYSESDQEVKDGHKTTKDVKISRDLEKDLPEGVSFGDVRTPEKMRTQTIDHSKLVPLLTGALQEAVAKIEDLEKRIEILEAK